MIRTFTIGLFFIAAYIICNSCKKDTQVVCPKPEYYAFTPSDLSKMPYTGKETLKFLYRNGKQADTFIFKPISTKFDTIYFGGTPVNEDCDQDVYGQHKKYVYQNTKKISTKYLFAINYSTQGGAANFTVKYDSISIDDCLININNPNWGHYHSSLTFEGTTFYAVSDYGNGTLTSYYTAYYTAHEGIIRMEYKNGASLTLLP